MNDALVEAIKFELLTNTNKLLIHYYVSFVFYFTVTLIDNIVVTSGANFMKPVEQTSLLITEYS